jgi:hypothetical protein
MATTGIVGAARRTMSGIGPIRGRGLRRRRVTSIPSDYEARVYAGVLGKIIGVYLGRPIEGWTYARISERLGDVVSYAFPVEAFRTHRLALDVSGRRIHASIDGTVIAAVVDDSPLWLAAGGVGLVCTEGTMGTETIRVSAPPDRREGARHEPAALGRLVRQ